MTKHATEGPQWRQFQQRHPVQDGADRHRPVDIDVRRDRGGAFTSKTVEERQRRLGGVDAMVISLCVKGPTAGDC